jgi:hypothetical protein
VVVVIRRLVVLLIGVVGVLVSVSDAVLAWDPEQHSEPLVRR